MNYIRRKGKEKTMLLVTHDLEEAEAMGDWICTCSRLDGFSSYHTFSMPGMFDLSIFVFIFRISSTAAAL